MTTTPYTILSAIAAQHRLADADNIARKLSDRATKAAKPSEKPTKLADGGGLTLYIPPSGRRVWQYRYVLSDKEQVYTLGVYPEIGLGDARTMHRAARWLVARGIHPKKHVDTVLTEAAAAAAAADETFSAICKQWQDATSKTLAPRTVKHRKEMLAAHVLPKIGGKPIRGIKRKELVELLTEIDTKAPVTAKTCRGYIKQCYNYAVDRELADGNPTPEAGVLIHNATRRHTPRKALPIGEVGEFLHAIETAGETIWHTKVGLRLLLLTWCRTQEIIGARTEEFDLSAGVWRIPPERMKGRKEHVIYLSAQAQEIVKQLIERQSDDPRKAGFLFPNWRRNAAGHMGRMTFNQWLVRHSWGARCDIHGFRATASTWANEASRYRPDVIEVALAHSDKDKVRSAYNRASYQAELTTLWQDWADKLTALEAKAQKENPGRYSQGFHRDADGATRPTKQL